MQRDQESTKQIQRYFNKYHNVILNNSKNVINVALVENRIEQELNDGFTRIRTAPCSFRELDQVVRQIKNKNERFNKDLILLNMSLSQDRNFCRGGLSGCMNRSVLSTRFFRKTNESVSEEQFKDYRQGQKMTNIRIKQLQRIQREIREQRLFRQKCRQRRQGLQQMKMRKEEGQQRDRKRVQKLKRIHERLCKLQEDKKNRLLGMRRGVGRSLPMIPRYKIMRQRYERQQMRYEDEENRRMKKIKNQKDRQYNMRLIRQHSQRYDGVIKERKRGRTEGDGQVSVGRLDERGYNKIGPNPEKVAECRKKMERMGQYDNMNVSRRNNMRLDVRVGRQFEAMKDRSKNPFKYHYLRIKKNLSDLQIYQNYNFFNFNSDPVEIGNVYLNQLRNMNERQRKMKIYGEKRGNQGFGDKIGRNNDLGEIRKKNKYVYSKDVEQIVEASGGKQRLLKVLVEQHKQGSKRRNSKRKSIGKGISYTNAIKMQLESDQNIIESMKIKLKGLKME